MKTNCDYCGKEYSTIPCEYNRRKNHFCSRECYKAYLPNKPKKKVSEIAQLQIDNDRKLDKLNSENRVLQAKVHLFKGELESANKRIEGLIGLDNDLNKTLEVFPSVKASEATAFICWSDAHFEEEVKSESVNDLNRYNLEIARERTTRMFERAMRLTDIFRKDITIKNIILWLGGDFITGYIHEEGVETNVMSPIEAKQFAQDMIIEAINYILERDYVESLLIPCNFGNHGRTTKKKRYATGYANNYEWDLYCNLAKLYAGNERVAFSIPKGYFNYIQVYDKLIRTHHGDNMRYLGGVGGLYIPVNKAIAQWNKQRVVDLDIFGHFHTAKYDTGSDKFISNGSLIGYNAFALGIKASYEPPTQCYFLIDKHGRRLQSCALYVSDTFY